MNEDVFRKIMAETLEVPSSLFLVRQGDEDGDLDMICGWFATYEKALACVRSQDYLFDHHYQIVEIDMKKLGALPWSTYDRVVVNVTDEQSHPDTPGYFAERLVEMMWTEPLAAAELRIAYFKKLASTPETVAFFDNILETRRAKENK